MAVVLKLCRCLNALKTGQIGWCLRKSYGTRSYYDILGVHKEAAADEIKDAFIKLSKQLHPDMNKADSKTHDKFVQVNEAYSVLSKPLLRRSYDKTLAEQFLREKQMRQNIQNYAYCGGRAPVTQPFHHAKVMHDELYQDLRWNRVRSHPIYRDVLGIRMKGTTITVIISLGLILCGIILFLSAYWYAKFNGSKTSEKSKRLMANDTLSKEEKKDVVEGSCWKKIIEKDEKQG
ncbi:hypothetical protein CHS0354_013799 [Potamilus streckersoni]|uniref:J domain-containing protein n=1 Tax=Potamilus streckersoni TaxID=2493646 RepID=A0AAE0VWH6_9BIVA|nr:hypothetical protein CHS0354_013799 [Potamilus streckersoni]